MSFPYIRQGKRGDNGVVLWMVELLQVLNYPCKNPSICSPGEYVVKQSGFWMNDSIGRRKKKKRMKNLERLYKE